jgi:hypothetical protein
MDLHEHECMKDSFYLGYLTILDFSMYEIVNHFQLLFPEEIQHFTKLIQIRDRVAALPEIKEYENSCRVVREYSPISYFKRFKEEKLRKTLKLMGLELIKNSTNGSELK